MHFLSEEYTNWSSMIQKVGKKQNEAGSIFSSTHAASKIKKWSKNRAINQWRSTHLIWKKTSVEENFCLTRWGGSSHSLKEPPWRVGSQHNSTSAFLKHHALVENHQSTHKSQRRPQENCIIRIESLGRHSFQRLSYSTKHKGMTQKLQRQ